MRYRERVSIEQATEQISTKGAVSYTYTTLHESVPATIVRSVDESRAADMQPEVDLYSIVLAGQPDVRPHDSVVDTDGRRFDIEHVEPLLGLRQVHLIARLVAWPSAPAGS